MEVLPHLLHLMAMSHEEEDMEGYIHIHPFKLKDNQNKTTAVPYSMEIAPPSRIYLIIYALYLME